jgi:glycosyltransferase involved in cell wall biosynthesis
MVDTGRLLDEAFMDDMRPGTNRPEAEESTAVRVDVVIPVLNEAHVLESSVETVRNFLREQAGWSAMVVVVDNGSTDGTDRVARRLEETHPGEVRFLQLPQRGRGRALRHAWTQSDADVMCYTDVDLSTELAALVPLVWAVAGNQYDLGTGSRLLPQSRTKRSTKRELISRAYNAIVRSVLWTSFSDAQCGFKVVSRQVVQEIVPEVRDQSWFFDTELLVLAEKRGFRLMDLPVQWIEDDDSRVKIISTAWEDLKGVARLRWKLWREALSSERRSTVAESRRV